MAIETLAAALEREHHEIDEGLEAYDRFPARRDPGVLTSAIVSLRRHIYLEEEFLFPPLVAAGLAAPVFVMLREHAEIWATLDALDRALDADEGNDPPSALRHRLVSQLRHHNLKEEQVLYPQADDVLTATAATGLRAFLETGQLPEGWKPTKAAAT